jgi:hypothetical protein
MTDSSFRKCGGSALCHLICSLICLSSPGIVVAQQGAAQKKHDAVVRAQIRNVRYHFSDNIAVQINSLTGALVPTNGNEFPVLDDKNSFRIHIDTAEIAIDPTDLANLLNSYVFARPNSPLSGISVETLSGRLQVKGKLRDKGDIPFESEGVMTPTPDGRIRLHSEKIKALHVPVKSLMDAFGIGVDDMIKSGKVPGVQAEDNDLILDLQQMLPPPHIDGKVTSVRVQRNSIIQTFGDTGTASAPKLQNANYMAFRGNRLRFGKLTIDDADIVLYDMDPADPMDFFLDHSREQVAAGYTKISPNFQLRVFLKDFDKLGKARSTAKSKVN